MRFAGFVLLFTALLGGSAYLFIHNGHSVELRLGEAWLIHAPLAAQLTGAFLVGAVGVFAAIGIRDSGRALARWRRRRFERRQERVGTLLTEGRRLLWRGEPERARGILARAWKARQSREGLLLLVDASLAADNAGDARRALAAAREPLADDPEVLCRLAAVCSRIGDNSGAIAALERARARHPRAATILVSLRDLYLEAERWPEAAALQAAWLALHPHVTAPHEHTLLAGARYEAARRTPGPTARIRALEEVLAQAPRFVPAAVTLGDELLAAGRMEEAVRRWETTLRLQPRSVLVDRLRAHAADRPARDRLRNTLRKLRFESLEGDAVRYYLALLWLDDGHAGHATAELDAASRGFEDAPAYHLARGRISELEGQLDKATAEYRAAAGALVAWSCNVCQRADTAWLALCPRCGRWDTLRGAVELVRDA
jgi:tetratricopeptide (TPR) repeat protein